MNVGDIGEKLRRSTVQLHVAGGRAGGSGVVATSTGLIVTNAHVVGGRGAEVQLWDGRRFPAKLLAMGRRHDLALLKVETIGLPEAQFASSNKLRPGELALAIGNPLGFTGALSTGVVYGIGPIRGLGPQTWVQADVRLAPGNSGGPLADASGRVIGINTMIAGGLALAIPSDTVQAFLEAADQRLRVRRGAA